MPRSRHCLLSVASVQQCRDGGRAVGPLSPFGRYRFDFDDESGARTLGWRKLGLKPEVNLWPEIQRELACCF